MVEKSKSFVTTINNILSGMWGILFLLFPLLFLTITTDVFIFPKQILLTFFTIVSLLLFGLKTIAEKKVRFLQTFLDFPVFIFIVCLILSTLASVDYINSIIFLV